MYFESFAETRLLLFVPQKRISDVTFSSISNIQRVGITF